MALPAGTRLGPYEIVAPLGAGGMGEVYRARDSRLGREVAIKVLPAEVAGDPERLRRFEQEAKAASALNHPNILTVHDVGNEGGVAYLVTELLHGESLREALRQGPLPVRRVVEISAQIARGLAAAHEKGIVHRDLKPDNLFLTSDGVAKILDFGLARWESPGAGALSEATTMADGTAAGLLLGTVGYMAPEQVRGERADARSDLFAFGCVLHEMLSGTNPFHRETAIDSFHAILKEEAPPIDSAAPVPAPLEQIARHCLEKAPERRFQSASDLAFALEQAAGSTAPQPAPPAPPPVAPRRLSPAMLLGGSAAILMLLLFLRDPGAVRRRFAGLPSAATIDSIAVLPLANFSGDASQDYFADGMTEALIAELAQIRALKVISRTSVMQYKNVHRPLPEIARELGVRGVVEGSVVREGGSVRITVQLIDAAQDRHLWAESYTRETRDVLRLQAELAQAIAKEVRVAVTPGEHDRLATARTVDPEAHSLLLQGIALQGQGNSQRDASERAVTLFRQAVERAPDFAAAHLALAGALWVVANNGYRPMREACTDSRSELERALALDPELPGGYAQSGALRANCDFDWAGAERDLERAVELAPGNAEYQAAYSFRLSSLGRHDEAIEHARRAEELDPLNEWLHGYVAARYYEARRFDEAAAQLDRMLETSPDSIYGKWLFGLVRTAQGRYDDAVTILASRKLAPPARPEMNFAVGLALGRAGRLAEARRVLDYLLEKRRTTFVPPTQIAIIYGAIGERGEGMKWLDQAYEERAMFLDSLAVDPMFDPLRGDPRFDALLAKMKLPKSP